MSDAVIDALSGAVGSIIALVLTYPLKVGAGNVQPRQGFSKRADDEVLSRLQTIYTLQALSSSNSADTNGAALSIVQLISKYRLTGLYTG